MTDTEAAETEVTITDGCLEPAGAQAPDSAGEPSPATAAEATSPEEWDNGALPGAGSGKTVVSVAELGNIQTLHRELDKVKDDDFKNGDSILGRYNVISAISKGATGPVFKCFDTLGGINVAVKCLTRDIVCNDSFMQEVVAAYSKAGVLRHTNITGFRTTGRNQRTKGFYIVRDIADGEDIRLWLHSHAGLEFAAEKFSHIRQLAAALEYAHGRGAVHGDIRPANIIISPDGHAELLNFGLSYCIQSGMTKYGIPRYGQESSLPYVAPEVIGGEAPTALSDQYSLAAVAYAAFSGTAPFSGSDVPALKRAVQEAEVPPLTTVAPHVAAAIAKAMSKNPAERFASCSEFADAVCAPEVNKAMSLIAGLPPFALLGAGVAIGAILATIIMLFV